MPRQLSAAAQARTAARNAEAARRLKARIAEQLRKGANKGVEAAIRFLAARWKETLSVPAPRRAVRSAPEPGKKLGGILYYVATTKATPGAPPRKLSGRFRQSVTQKMLTPTVGIVGANARSDKNFNYPAHHELGKSGQWGGGLHQSLKPTVEANERNLRILVGAAVRTELRIQR